MHSFRVIAGTTYGDITRRPIYSFTLVLFALLIYASNFLTQFTFYQEMNMVREMGVASLVLWGFIIVVVLSGSIVTQELEDRTAVTLLSKPIRRSAFLVGKYVGMLLAVFVGMAVLSGVLFFTLWWMAKSDLFGHPDVAATLAWVGLITFVGGLTALLAELVRIRRLEGDTAVRAPRGRLRAAVAIVVLGAGALILAAEFSVGSVGRGDWAHYRFWRQSGGTYTVWEFVGSFLETNGSVVLSGFLLGFCQVAILAAVCLSLAAFLPPVVSVSGTAVAFLLGNLASYMFLSLKQIESPVATVVGTVLYYGLPNLSYFNLQSHFSEGRIISLGYLGLALLHAALYSSLALTVSCTLFERREIR